MYEDDEEEEWTPRDNEAAAADAESSSSGSSTSSDDDGYTQQRQQQQQQQQQQLPLKRGRGRPKGSKNKPKLVPASMSESQQQPPQKRGRGRPKGSKNKPKALPPSVLASLEQLSSGAGQRKQRRSGGGDGDLDDDLDETNTAAASEDAPETQPLGTAVTAEFPPRKRSKRRLPELRIALDVAYEACRRRLAQQETGDDADPALEHVLSLWYRKLEDGFERFETLALEADEAEADIAASQKRHQKLRGEIVAARQAVIAAEAQWRDMQEENARREESAALVEAAGAFMRALAA